MSDDCTPTTELWIEAALAAAWEARAEADCLLNQVGAVGTLGTTIVAAAANHALEPGRRSCPGPAACEREQFLDPTIGVCTRGTHAEAALLERLKHVGLLANTVAVTSVPCQHCAELLEQHGVEQLVLLGTHHAYAKQQLDRFQLRIFSRPNYVNDGSLVEIEAP